MIYAHNNYVDILKEELESRCGANPSYSLRAYARDLKIAASRLSAVLNSKQGLSLKYATLIASKIGLSEQETKYFCDLVESKHARSNLQKRLAEKRIKAKRVTYDTDPITTEVFKVISDWYHLAILELTYLKEFESDVKWIAKALDINIQVADNAIKRLIKVGMLEVVAGKYVSAEDFTMSSDGISSDSIKKFHKQILDKASSAISLQTMEERNFSAVTFAFDKNQIQEVKNEIKGFRRGILKKYGQSQQSNSVYNLSIQFFNLSRGINNENNN